MSNTARDILETLAIKTANEYGGFVGFDTNDEQILDQAEQAINKEIDKAVYGFHEYIIGKGIIKDEADHTYNYARLHKALDDYISELKDK